MTATTKPLVLTAGEPAGIGPELIIKLAQQNLPMPIMVIADEILLQQRAQQLGVSLANKQLMVHHVACPNIDCIAKPDVKNAAYVLQTLDIAAQGCLNGDFCAMVTAPIQKSVINAAGIPFSGHTEYLAALAHVEKTVMLLQSAELKVALVTTHLPLTHVPKAITKENLTQTIKILHADLQNKFAIAQPKIYVCGLNPHAGEQGHLGREEIDIIEPVLRTLNAEGYSLVGPLAADTIFTEKHLQHAHCVLAMYHDQGLPVLKAKAFGASANITLGLPFIRTSVDHGTALDIAGTGKASIKSFLYAIKTAYQLAGISL